MKKQPHHFLVAPVLEISFQGLLDPFEVRYLRLVCHSSVNEKFLCCGCQSQIQAAAYLCPTKFYFTSLLCTTIKKLYLLRILLDAAAQFLVKSPRQ